jgi:hypothetical protein
VPLVPGEAGVPLAPVDDEPLLLLCSSLMHFSRSVPVMPTHLAGVAAVEPDAPLEPEAAGDDDELELCAIDTLARAKSAAAVAVLTSLSIAISSFTRVGGCCGARQATCVPFGTTKKAGPPMLRADPLFVVRRGYFDVPELEPLLLGLLLLGLLLLEEPLLEAPPLEEPLLLGDELLGDELSLVPPVELDLKCASHSLREIWPSLLVSTLVKLGVSLDAPLELLPPLDMLPELPPLELLLGEELLSPELLLGDELEELPPLDAPDEPLLPVVALGEDEDLSLLEAPLADEPALCAETLASAKSAAAVAVVISFNFIW